MCRSLTIGALMTCVTCTFSFGQDRDNGTLRYNVRIRTSAVQQRERSIRLVDLDGARQGSYYRWKPAAGANRKGYTAPDGTVWRLMESSGMVRVDEHGRITERSDTNHSQRFIWRIEKDSMSTRTVWVSRDPKTGTLSFLYRRPATNSRPHYRANATIGSNFHVVGIDWVERPSWADDRSIARQLRQGLPSGIYRRTRDEYVPAVPEDLTQL